jgi:ABC-type antimicrobial peptide transport system permease subunit
VLVASAFTIGLFGALAAARLLSTALWGVTPTDPLTYFLVSLLLGTVALLATYVPARRALRVVPTVALRGE